MSEQKTSYLEDGTVLTREDVDRLSGGARRTMTSFTIPEGVTRIGGGAFRYCDQLISVTIPDSVTSIEAWAFHDCKSLTSITIPASVTSIGAWAFHGCTGLTSITIPDSVTSIGHDAFLGCTGLTSVTIPSSVTSIGYRAFDGCASLEAIIVVKNNPVYCAQGGILFNKEKTVLLCCPPKAVRNCYYIPNSVTSIGNDAFYGCASLTSVTVPASVTNIGFRAFSDCANLAEIIVAEENPAHCSVDGFLFSKDKTDLLRCPPKAVKDHYDIPSGVTAIEDWAFDGCASLTSVMIPDSVDYIGDEAFRNCTSLTSVTIPDSVRYIGVDAFNDCDQLTAIVQPDSYAEAYCWENDFPTKQA